VIEERFDPDRTVLTLPFMKKATKKRQEQYAKILSFMQSSVWYKASDLMIVLGVKETRTKELLRALISEGKIIDDGATKGKRYKRPMFDFK
jgi:ATP-dependent DNA helicase RecG